jgi:hypothetical protein
MFFNILIPILTNKTAIEVYATTYFVLSYTDVNPSTIGYHIYSLMKLVTLITLFIPISHSLII